MKTLACNLCLDVKNLLKGKTPSRLELQARGATFKTALQGASSDHEIPDEEEQPWDLDGHVTCQGG